jgi:hypothetical protein
VNNLFANPMELERMVLIMQIMHTAQFPDVGDIAIAQLVCRLHHVKLKNRPG